MLVSIAELLKNAHRMPTIKQTVYNRKESQFLTEKSVEGLISFRSLFFSFTETIIISLSLTNLLFSKKRYLQSMYSFNIKYIAYLIENKL